MVLSLDYWDLSRGGSAADKLAKELGQYCDDLSRKVQKKMYSVEGGMSSSLNSADYYVNQKIRQLHTRESNAKALSSKTKELIETAKRVDSDVEKTIKQEQKSLFKEHSDLKAPWFDWAFTSFMCDMKNVPVIGWLIKGGEQFAGAIETLGKDIKHWWKCGGGKELVMNCLDIVVKIGFAVAAVITAVTAVAALVMATVLTLGGVVFAVAACIAAVISVINAATNTVTSVQGIAASRGGDPVMSQIYSERDTLAQVLRDYNFHDKKKNRNSVIAALTIEITDAVTGIVLIVQSIGKIVGSFLSKNGVGFAFKELARGSDGKLTTKVTLKSIWKGTKALILNKKLTTSTSAGLRTTLRINLVTNIKQALQSIRYQVKLFKLAMRDPVKWMETKETGDLGFFQNITEKVRYNVWQRKNSGFMDKKKNLFYNLEKYSKLTSTFNNSLSNINLILNGLEKEDNKGIARRITEKYFKNKVFNNDFTKLLNKIGLGKKIADIDKTGMLEDYVGFGGKGILQKIEDIRASVENAVPSFSIKSPQINIQIPDFNLLYPQYECVVEAAYAG